VAVKGEDVAGADVAGGDGQGDVSGDGGHDRLLRESLAIDRDDCGALFVDDRSDLRGGLLRGDIRAL
jgi:hypothetical protein